METVAVELLMALAGSTASAAGQQAWQSLRELLVRRPRGGEEASGLGELRALDEEPESVERARALARALTVRAEQEHEFGQRLRTWLREEAEPARDGRTGAGDVHSEVSGTVHGSVLMGRDFNGTINLG
ncbi:hypothetical protein ACFY8B_28865 [Streptomyces sp. NPDC012751]|uniref:hypothetical protein n=1 Tax=Streptomyces sp. NPDC012751 TaxID=3364846 RepID=UPI0036AC3F58